MTGTGPDDGGAASGEYVLGTLDRAERSAFEARLTSDARLRAEVRDWTDRLASLQDLSPAVDPPPGAWASVQRALFGPVGGVVDGARITRLERRVASWRWSAIASGSVAAALALAILAGVPTGLRRPSDTYLAVVTPGGAQPALLVRVDVARGRLTVQPLAPAAPPGRSLQLWYIAGDAPPKSLGLVGSAPSEVALPAGLMSQGTVLAVSAEPPGGSPSASPTGPVVYSGQLIRE